MNEREVGASVLNGRTKRFVWCTAFGGIGLVVAFGVFSLSRMHAVKFAAARCAFAINVNRVDMDPNGNLVLRMDLHYERADSGVAGVFAPKSIAVAHGHLPWNSGCQRRVYAMDHNGAIFELEEYRVATGLSAAHGATVFQDGEKHAGELMLVVLPDKTRTLGQMQSIKVSTRAPMYLVNGDGASVKQKRGSLRSIEVESKWFHLADLPGDKDVPIISPVAPALDW